MLVTRIKVDEALPEFFTLGRQGENGVRQICFDVSAWLAEYGDGAVALLAQRTGDDAPYPVTLTAADGEATWTVNSADTAYSGTGRAELRLTADGVLKKSKIYGTVVDAALAPPSAEPPDPYDTWLDDMMDIAVRAEDAAERAEDAVGNAVAYRQSIENLGVMANTLPPGSNATADKSVDAQGQVTLHFGIPRGDVGPQGAAGPQGPQGVQGAQGERGVSGVAVAAEGQYAFNVDANGHLILGYTGEDAPNFSINSSGHLILTL